MSEHSGLNAAAKVAQLTRAAMEIIKGALAGGLHGAAIGAVKAFAPQLIKIVIVLIALFIILPICIFVALPSAMFGFDTATNSDILQMNAKSAEVDSLYENFDDIFESEAQSLIDDLSEGYDEVSATSIEELAEKLGYNWIAAIMSVKEQQDLHSINEDSVRSVARVGIKYSTQTESYETVEIHIDPDTGEETQVTVTKNKISVDVEQEDADRLMDKLGFSDFQKEWAYFIYKNLEEKQTVDGGDYTPEDLGDLVFTDGVTEVFYYNQKDIKWGDLSYGKSDTIAESGCGPTALAIVVSSLTDTKINPKEMADWAYDNGYCIPHGGSYHSLIPEGAEHFGLSVTGARANEAQKIIDALADGKLVVAIMGKGTFTSTGHFIVLRGVTAEGKILVADPFSINFSNREWDLSLILNEASKRAGSGGPFWLIGGD